MSNSPLPIPPCARRTAALRRLALVCLVGVTATGSALGETPGRARLPESVELLRAQRQAAAEPTTRINPFYSTAGEDRTAVYLISQTAEPVAVTLTALDASGQALPLGTYTLEPSRHLELHLDELLRGAAESFHQGSLQLDFLGDANTLQGWTVLRRGRQALEIPFHDPAGVGARRLVSFWDASAHPGAVQARFFLANGGSEPLRYSVEVGQGTRTVDAFTGQLDPGARRVLTFPAARQPTGWLRIEHDGAPGALAASGLLAGRSHLSQLVVASPGDLDLATEHESIRIPLTAAEGLGAAGSRPRGVRPVITLFNPRSEGIEVRVELLEQASGAALRHSFVALGPGEVRSFDTAHLLAAPEADGAARSLREPATGQLPAELRARISGDRPFLVAGSARLPGGEVLDIAFFRAANAHANGSYPLPNLDTHEVFTTFVNLGRETARLGAQISWRGGTYAYGPVEVPAGASHRLELAELVATAEPDLLGRRLDSRLDEAYLQWSTVDSDSERLIARTEARPRDGRDTFGFNCHGCCWEIPDGSVLPGSVTLTAVGQSKSFIACEFIDTCNGTLGPYAVTPSWISAAAPFSWNGSTVSASAGGRDDLIFGGDDTQILPSCSTTNRTFFGDGEADACDIHLKKSGSLQKWSTSTTCSQQTGNCTKCSECCTKTYNWQVCKCGSSAPCLQQANSARSSCFVLCAIDLGCD